MNSIFITDEAGNIVDLSKLIERIERLEKFLPVIQIPKTKRKSKSNRVKMIEQRLRKSFS